MWCHSRRHWGSGIEIVFIKKQLDGPNIAGPTLHCLH
jgi:hypothetical protein